MEDISIELLEKIKKFFSSQIGQSERIKELLEKLNRNNVDYEDAHKYAIEIGELLAKAFEENIDASTLPKGKMYYNIAKKVVEPSLKDSFDYVSDFSIQTQKILNKQAEIGLRVQKPEFNQAKSNGIIRRLADAESYEDIAWILKDPVVNFNQSIVDDTIEANAKLHSKVGMHPTITRKVSGHACKWCMNLAGTYLYPDDVPDDIYRRHRDCRCVVLYKPTKGKYVQDVHSKKWEKVSEINNKISDYTSKKRQELNSKRSILLEKQENLQSYKPIVRGDSRQFIYNSNTSLNVRKVDSYKDYDVYVSDNVVIKRKALHDIKNRNEDAISKWKIKEKPKIVIFGDDDGILAYGKYDAITNTVFYSKDISNKEMQNKMRTEYHEMWHMKQAENFKDKYGVITEENYFEYIQFACDEAKKNIDALGITEYNVNEISKYAAKNYLLGRYDEVEAEYWALIKKG